MRRASNMVFVWKISLIFLIGVCAAGQWEVLYPNVMTIAIGVSAPDNKNVYVTGGQNGVGSAILKSSDEGQTWNSLPHDPQMLYLDVEISKGTTGGAASGLGMFGIVSGVSVTSDGDNFQSMNDAPTFLASQSVACPTSDSFYVTGFYQKRLIGGAGSDGVLVSLDGGKSNKFYDWGVETQARYGSFPSSDVWFVSGGTWPVELGSRYDNPLQLSSRIKIKTSSNMQKMETVINTQQQQSMEGEKNGYIGVISRTVDGGKTFQVVFNDTGRFYFNGIDCSDTKRCWAVAEGPLGAYIYHTPDGGETWIQQYRSADNSGSLIDIKMINAQEGWAVGGVIKSVTFDALFLKTVDGGQTWTNENTIPNAYPNSLTVVSRDRAYATAFLRNGLSSILVYR